MAPKWLCFSVAKRLGGADVVPLIQIKRIRTEVRTVRTRSANGLVPCGERVLSEQLNPIAPHHLSSLDQLRIQARLLPIKTLVLSGH